MLGFKNSVMNIIKSLEQTDRDIVSSRYFNLNFLKINSHVQTADFLDTMITHGFNLKTLPTIIKSM